MISNERLDPIDILARAIARLHAEGVEVPEVNEEEVVMLEPASDIDSSNENRE